MRMFKYERLVTDRKKERTIERKFRYQLKERLRGVPVKVYSGKESKVVEIMEESEE